MGTAAKFGSICFTLQAVLLIIVNWIFPDLYPGDSFMIILVYVVEIPIAAIVYPLFFWAIKSSNLGKNAYLVLFFILMLLIINLVPLTTAGNAITILQLTKIFSHSSDSAAAIVEFFDPVLSFIIVAFLMKKFNSSFPLSGDSPSADGDV